MTKLLQVYDALTEPKTVYRLSHELHSNWNTVKRNLVTLQKLGVVTEQGTNPNATKLYMKTVVK